MLLSPSNRIVDSLSVTSCFAPRLLLESVTQRMPIEGAVSAVFPLIAGAGAAAVHREASDGEEQACGGQVDGEHKKSTRRNSA